MKLQVLVFGLLASLVLVAVPLAQDITPARQSILVRFDNPVKVGDHILMGKYVIEHDNDRMAAGKPCTHIYSTDNLREPVLTFYCTHLRRERVDQPTVVLRRRSGDVSVPTALSVFQFAGETDAHGVPVVR